MINLVVRMCCGGWLVLVLVAVVALLPSFANAPEWRE